MAVRLRCPWGLSLSLPSSVPSGSERPSQALFLEEGLGEKGSRGRAARAEN